MSRHYKMEAILLLGVVVFSCLLNVESRPHRGFYHDKSGKHALSRLQHKEDKPGDGLHVSVDPSVAEEDWYGYVSAVCTASAGERVEDLPYITFYWQLQEDALVPLSSSLPGVHVEAFDGGMSSKGQHLYGQRITIEEPMLKILSRGDNIFVCKANNMAGGRDLASFIVRTL